MGTTGEEIAAALRRHERALSDALVHPEPAPKEHYPVMAAFRMTEQMFADLQALAGAHGTTVSDELRTAVADRLSR